MSSSTRDKLLGSWTLLSFTMHHPSNPAAKQHPLGPNAVGRIMYHPDGHMSAFMMNKSHGREFTFPTENPYETTTEQKAQAWLNAFGYTGEWWVADSSNESEEGGAGVEKAGEEGPILVHSIQYANVPNWVNTIQQRLLKWDKVGEEMTLGAVPSSKAGIGMVTEIKWRKEAANEKPMPPREQWV